MEETAWFRLLKEIFSNDKYWEMEEEDVEELSDKLNEDEERINQAIDNLQKQGFIKKEMEKVVLTERGFNLISTMETHEEQLLTERLLLVFVTALSLGTLIETAVTLNQSGNIVLNMAYYILFAIIFIVLGMIAKQNLE